MMGAKSSIVPFAPLSKRLSGNVSGMAATVVTVVGAESTITPVGDFSGRAVGLAPELKAFIDVVIVPALLERLTKDRATSQAT